MNHWPDRRLLDLLGLEIPIVQAPMAGSDSPALTQAVSSTGALGSLACALLNPADIREAASAIRRETTRPFNLNFFCHPMADPNSAARERWKAFLQSHYERLGLDIDAVPESRLRLPFNEEMCEVVEEVCPEVVSFHFGLPSAELVQRLKVQGIKILGSATSVREARWLEERGCDAVIVQGFEAGGHRAMFLETNVSTQVGLFALLPQVADAVSVPVIATGGIAEARGVVAAFALGASAVQLGTAYLFCPEAKISPMYRSALEQVPDTGTAITNLFSGRPARGIVNRYIEQSGPMAPEALAFPYAATLVNPLRAASEKAGSLDYMQMWAGQAAALARAMPAAEFTRRLAADALELLRRHGSKSDATH
jgi:nitronate monooxygenase